MRFPNKLPFRRCRNMSAASMSGTFSRKYPVCCSPFTRTPSSRRRVTQRQTVDRDTPISRAIRAPLTTIVAFSASSVSSAAIRRSVVPGSVSDCAFVRRAMIFYSCRRINVVEPNVGEPTPASHQTCWWPTETDVSLRFLDEVHKQAQVRGRGRMGERTRRAKISACFCVGPCMVEGDPAGNLHDGVAPYSSRQLHATSGLLGTQVVEQ